MNIRINPHDLMIKLMLASAVVLGTTMTQPAFAHYYEQSTVYTQHAPVVYYSSQEYYPDRQISYDYYGRDWHRDEHQSWNRRDDHNVHQDWGHDHENHNHWNDNEDDDQ
jgi:hypothetical protein